MKIKRILSVLAPLLLVFSAPVFGQNQIPVNPVPQSRVIDNAALLAPEEEARLAGRIEQIAQTYDFDLVIVTENSIANSRPMDYADDFFDYNGYGLGGDRDGCLLLQVTETRDYWFSTSGRGIGILNSTAFRRLEKDTVKFLGSADFAGAYSTFIQDWEIFLALDAKGRSYNFFYEWNLVLTACAWLVSLLIGFLTVAAWKARMNTAISQTQAGAYVVPGSLSFTVQSDRFLYSTVSRSSRETQSSSGGGTHTSSSGRSHGGGGGKY